MWSLGVILYILLSGLPPFWGDTEDQIFKMVLKGVIDFKTDPWWVGGCRRWQARGVLLRACVDGWMDIWMRERVRYGGSLVAPCMHACMRRVQWQCPDGTAAAAAAAAACRPKISDAAKDCVRSLLDQVRRCMHACMGAVHGGGARACMHGGIACMCAVPAPGSCHASTRAPSQLARAPRRHWATGW